MDLLQTHTHEDPTHVPGGYIVPAVQHYPSPFWPTLTTFCADTTTLWSLAGDLNAMVAPFECKSGGHDARRKFLNFLQVTNSRDLWAMNGDHNHLKDWTVRSQSEGTKSGNIIDHVVSSSDTLIDAEISVAD